MPTTMSQSPERMFLIMSTTVATSLQTVRVIQRPTVTSTHRITLTRTHTSQQTQPRGSYQG